MMLKRLKTIHLTQSYILPSLVIVLSILWQSRLTAVEEDNKGRDEKEHVSMEVDAPKKCAAGENLMIKVSVLNNSENIVTIGKYIDGIACKIEIFDELKRKMPLTRYGEKTLGIRVGSSINDEIKPGKSIGYKINLVRFYDLSESGKFKVNISVLASHPGQKELIKLEVKGMEIRVIDSENDVDAILSRQPVKSNE